MQLTLINNNLYVAFTDGASFFGNITKEDTMVLNDLQALMIKGSIKQEEFELKLKELVFPKVREFEKQEADALDLIASITGHPDFYENDGKLYHKAVNMSIPKAMADEFRSLIKANSPDLDAWIKFWCWTSLNPSSDSREAIYKWKQGQKIQLTPDGLMICYRRVVKPTGGASREDRLLFEFVNKEYNRLRTNKKSTNVEVFYNEDKYYTSNNEYFSNIGQHNGNLKDLFLNQADTKEDNYYVDNYSGAVHFIIGKETFMSREEVDSNPANSGSRGLHCAGKGFSYSGFGDTPIAVLLNPKDIVCIFHNDWGKARVCALTPIAILGENHEWVDIDGVGSLIDRVHQDQIAKLETELKGSTIVDDKQQSLFPDKGNMIPTLPNTKNILAILNS